MKVLSLIVFTVAFSAKALALDQCAERAKKAAVMTEALSQNAPIAKIDASASLLNKGVAANFKVAIYKVVTQDRRNDGFSIYQVSVDSDICKIIQNVTLVTQD